MSYSLPDHPDIVWIERTGYPRNNQPKREYCEECGADVTDSTIYEDNLHECLCLDCLCWLHERM